MLASRTTRSAVEPPRFHLPEDIGRGFSHLQTRRSRHATGQAIKPGGFGAAYPGVRTSNQFTASFAHRNLMRRDHSSRPSPGAEMEFDDGGLFHSIGKL